MPKSSNPHYRIAVSCSDISHHHSCITQEMGKTRREGFESLDIKSPIILEASVAKAQAKLLPPIFHAFHFFLVHHLQSLLFSLLFAEVLPEHRFHALFFQSALPYSSGFMSCTLLVITSGLLRKWGKDKGGGDAPFV